MRVWGAVEALTEPSRLRERPRRTRPSRPFSAPVLQLGALLAVTVFAACGDWITDPPQATTITVSPATADLAPGATVQLSARVLDKTGRAMAGASVTWASNNTSVATVDASGLVTAVAEGTAAITATAGEASGVATVTVDPLALDGNEQYPGQNALTNKVGRGNLEGTLVINDEPGTWHAGVVKETAVNAGVPDSHIVTLLTFMDRENWENPTLDLPEGTRTLVVPLFPAFFEDEGVPFGNQNAVIGIGSAGNVNGDTDWQRDIFHPNHPAGSGLEFVYGDMMAALRAANGKAVLATWAIINEDGTAEPVRGAVSCGDTKDWCFAVRVPDYLPHLTGDVEAYLHEVGGTSLASPILGALVFYLSQLWDTADEVFAVLKECAIDIGEPGPDREFGLGVPTAHCDVVRERAQQVSSASMSARGPSPAVPSLAAPAGTGLSPLGASSSPAGSERWSYFAGAGVRKTVLAGNTASLSLLSRAERGGGRSRP